MSDHHREPASGGNSTFCVVLGVILLGGAALFVPALFIATTSCIVEGSPIATPGGDRPIEELEAGDEVWTLGVDGTRQTGTIVEIYSARADAYLEITVAGVFFLYATPPHPVATAGGWTPAG